LTISHKICKTF